MRVLVTGGAGFVGGNLGVAARRAPSRLGDRRARQPDAARLGAQPAAAARGRGRVRPRRRARARRPRGRRRLRRDDRVLGRALGARRDRRRLLLGADQPARRLQLPRAGPRARMPSSSSSRPAASTRSRRSSALALEETETRLELAAEQPVAGAPARRGSPRSFPMAGRAHALRRHQARRRAC